MTAPDVEPASSYTPDEAVWVRQDNTWCPGRVITATRIAALVRFSPRGHSGTSVDTVTTDRLRKRDEPNQPNPEFSNNPRHTAGMDVSGSLPSRLNTPPESSARSRVESTINRRTDMTLKVDASAALRAAMVTALRDEGFITSDRVAAAMNAVPREVFAPGEPLDKAYQTHTTLAPKAGPNGRATSVVSASHIQAIQLEQASIQAGMNVLEVGSGGYNAALIAELVGPAGSVTTVDIDADIVARAREGLQTAGYQRVNVVLADAEAGVARHAPYDRILVTTGAWDIPPAWRDQLGPHGRIVVPLRFAGITRLIAFDQRPGIPMLTASNYRLGSFVPMQGEGAVTERVLTITPDLALRLDPHNAALFDISALRKALHSPPLQRWSGTSFDMPDELELFLLTSGPSVPMLHAAQPAIDQGLINRTVRLGTPAIIRGGSFAYRIKRENTTMASGYETGVIAHGPEAEHVANALLTLIRNWAGRYYRRGAAHITYHPGPADADGLTGWRTTKRHGVLAVRWH